MKVDVGVLHRAIQGFESRKAVARWCPSWRSFAVFVLLLMVLTHTSFAASMKGLFPLPGVTNPLNEFDAHGESGTSLFSSFTYTGADRRGGSSDIALQRFAGSMLLGIAYGGQELRTAFAIEHSRFSHGVLPEDDVLTSVHLRRGGPQGWASARYQWQDTEFTLHTGIGATSQIGFGIEQATHSGSFGYQIGYGRQEAEIDIVWPLLALGLDLELRPLTQRFHFRYRILSLALGYVYTELQNTEASYDILGRVDTWAAQVAVSPGPVKLSAESLYHRGSANLFAGGQKYGQSGTLQLRYGKATALYVLSEKFTIGTNLELLDWKLDGRNFVSVLPFSPYGPLVNIRFRIILWDGFLLSPGAQLTYQSEPYVISDGRRVSWNMTGDLRYYELESTYAYEQRTRSPLTIYSSYSPNTGELVSQWGLLGELRTAIVYHGKSVSGRLELHQLIPLYDHDRLDSRGTGTAGAISGTSGAEPSFGPFDTRGTTVQASVILLLWS